MRAMLRALNVQTGEARVVPRPPVSTLTRDEDRGSSVCVGPCRCPVDDPEGFCGHGWPTRYWVGCYGPPARRGGFLADE